MNKYTVIKSTVINDSRNVQTLGVMVLLLSGKYDDVEQDQLHISFDMAKGTFNKCWKHLLDLGYVVVTKEGWRVTDSPKLDESGDPVSVGLFEPDNPLLIWLNKKCPRVQKMKQPITLKQAIELMDLYKTAPEKEALKETFEAMENNAQLHSKYVSAEKTLSNWIKSRLEKINYSNPSSTYTATA